MQYCRAPREGAAEHQHMKSVDSYPPAVLVLVGANIWTHGIVVERSLLYLIILCRLCGYVQSSNVVVVGRCLYLRSQLKLNRMSGRSSGGGALCCKGLDPPTWWIDPAWWMHLQFGLFSIPTSGLQLVHQRL